MHGVVTKESDTTKKEWLFPTAFSAWGSEECDAIDRVLTSGQLTIGEEVTAFEQEFAAYHRMKHGIMVNSGSSANLIMIAALFHIKERKPLRRGDEALVPALAWSTTYAPLVQHGLNLRLVDIDDTWCAKQSEIHVENSKLVVGCSVLGNAAPLEFMRVAADANEVYFVEDNCESLGAWCGVRRCGTFGLMNSFSFYFSHQISAVEGGMILTDNDECARLCKILRAHGWTRDVTLPASFDQEYDFTHFGYNVRPIEMHAAIGREQLRKLSSFILQRRANSDLFRRLCTSKDLPVKFPVIRGEPSPFSLHFTVKGIGTRQRLVEHLRAAGVDCRMPTGGSFHLHKYGARWRSQETPKADEIHRTGLFLGNGPLDLSEQIGLAVSVMEGAL